MNRIGSFDFVKAFAMFLVIWGHCILHIASWDRLDDTTFVFINSFHMPLFMIVAGYFSVSSLKMNFKSLTLKKFKELIIPCLIWGVVLFLISLLLASKINATGTAKCFFNSMVIDLWFLKSLFCCYLMAFLVTRTNRYVAVTTAMGCMVFTLYKINVMFPAFMLGVLVRKKNLLENNTIVSWKFASFLAMVFVCMTIFYDANFLNSPNHMFSIIKSESLPLWFTYFYKTFYRIVVGCSGALLVIILCYKYMQKASGIACRIGQKTMGIYIIQTVALEKIMSHYLTYRGGVILFDWILCPVMTVVIMVVSYWLIMLIDRNKKWSKLLLGR